LIKGGLRIAFFIMKAEKWIRQIEGALAISGVKQLQP
jgi:hypothetical protein